MVMESLYGVFQNSLSTQKQELLGFGALHPGAAAARSEYHILFSFHIVQKPMAKLTKILIFV